MLYIVATPIGNLDDLSIRAVSILRSVDTILAEDTRTSRVLLDHYNIKTPLIAYHQHSDERAIGRIVSLLGSGKKLALVSDAGTPGINDPGNYLISRILEELPDCKICPIPGPNAAVAALSISGFPTDHFVYLGFPPLKKGRQTFFRELGQIEETVVFYESKHRIIKSLDDLVAHGKIGQRPILVARELTKQFETVYRGTVERVKMKLTSDQQLGEFVVVVAPIRFKSRSD